MKMNAIIGCSYNYLSIIIRFIMVFNFVFRNHRHIAFLTIFSIDKKSNFIQTSAWNA